METTFLSDVGDNSAFNDTQEIQNRSKELEPRNPEQI